MLNRPLPPPDPELQWDRHPGESDKAFHAFTHYRELGAARSVDKAWHAHQAQCERKQWPRRKRAQDKWFEWSHAHDWVDRVRAYDSYIDKETRTRIAKDQIDAKAQHAKALAATLQTILIPVRCALETIQDPAVMQRVVNEARTSTRQLMALVNMASWAARAMPPVVQAHRLSLGLTTDEVVVEDRRSVIAEQHDQHLALFADRIVADPELQELAIRLLGQLTAPAGEGAPKRVGASRLTDGTGVSVADGSPSGPDHEDAAGSGPAEDSAGDD